MKKYSFFVLAVLLCLTGVIMAQWRLPVVTYRNPDSTIMVDTLVAGTDSSASGGLDPDIDIVCPPPAPGLRLTFFENSCDFTDFIADIRSASADDIIWSIVYHTPSATDSFWVTWDPSELPPDGDFRALVSTEIDSFPLTSMDDSLDWNKATDMRMSSRTSPCVSYKNIYLRYQSESRVDSRKVSSEASSLSLQPNPFSEVCHIKTPTKSEIEIFDISGKKVAELPKGKASWKPDKNTKSGVYILSAEYNGKLYKTEAIYLN